MSKPPQPRFWVQKLIMVCLGLLVLKLREFSRARGESPARSTERARRNKGAKMSKSAIWVLVVLAILARVSSIDDKCAACKAVAAEIEIGISNEKPRNHVDLRHRLDSKGQREGKVIDYRVSDLRVVELLDGLCEKMQDYTLEKFDSGKQGWVKVTDWDNLKSDKREARAHSKYISSFCGRLLEETEDELADWIKRGSGQTGGVSKVLCQDLSRHCSSPSAATDIDEL